VHRLGKDRMRAAMHLQIDEAGERLIRRYVANGSHSWPMRIGLTESRSAGGTEQTAGRAWGQYHSRINWIDGRRIRAAPKAPQRKRPCRSRRCPSIPSFFVRCANPSYGADRRRAIWGSPEGKGDMVFRTAGAIATLLIGLGSAGGQALAQYYPPPRT
jgi:hypothetical protein